MEIGVHSVLMRMAPTLTLAVSQMPGWVGPLLVVVLGLALLGAYVGRLLFTPFEEAVLVSEGRALREPPPPERYRLGGRLLHHSRYR